MPERSVTGSRRTVTMVSGLLLAAGSTELLLLRIGTRTAVHIPGVDALSGPLRTVAEAGRLAFYLAVVLLVALLILLVADAGDRITAGSVAAFLGAAGLARAGLLPAHLLGVALLGILVLLVAPMRHRLPEALFALLYVLAFVVAAGDQLVGSGRAGLPLLAEGLAVAAGLAAPLAVRRSKLRRIPLVAGLATGSLVTAALALSPWTTKILLLWNFGLAGSLPAVAYGLAAGCLAYAVAAAMQTDRHRLAWGLGLLVLGGVGLLSTYQSGLTVAGLALTGRAVTEAEPDRTSVTTPSVLARAVPER